MVLQWVLDLGEESDLLDFWRRIKFKLAAVTWGTVDLKLKVDTFFVEFMQTRNKIKEIRLSKQSRCQKYNWRDNEAGGRRPRWDWWPSGVSEGLTWELAASLSDVTSRHYLGHLGLSPHWTWCAESFWMITIKEIHAYIQKNKVNWELWCEDIFKNAVIFIWKN